MRDGGGTSFVVTESITVEGEVGDIVSLVPWGGAVSGVTTTGLRWPLVGATLSPFAGLGVSNELTSAEATIGVEAGVLLVVRPVGV